MSSLEKFENKLRFCCTNDKHKHIQSRNFDLTNQNVWLLSSLHAALSELCTYSHLSDALLHALSWSTFAKLMFCLDLPLIWDLNDQVMCILLSMSLERDILSVFICTKDLALNMQRHHEISSYFSWQTLMQRNRIKIWWWRIHLTEIFQTFII